jgi:hypothetical protein
MWAGPPYYGLTSCKERAISRRVPRNDTSIFSECVRGIWNKLRNILLQSLMALPIKICRSRMSRVGRIDRCNVVI